jgi:hypothetical protein
VDGVRKHSHQSDAQEHKTTTVLGSATHHASMINFAHVDHSRMRTFSSGGSQDNAHA